MSGGGGLCRESVLAILLWRRILRARVALQPDESGEVAETNWARRDGETAGGNDRSGATAAGAEACRDAAGECGHDGAGEGDRLSHGCAAVSQSALRVGARSKAGRA